MDTVPLLTPTMETELLKQPWVFPQPKVNTVKEEDKRATSSVWEENFQDLSGWCMDTFQGQCDFPIGESPAFKLSGTKYEGNSVLSSGEGVLKDLLSVTDEEKWNTKMNTTAAAERMNNNCYNFQSTSKATSKLDQEDVAESNTSYAWLKQSKGTAAATSTAMWSKQSNTDTSTPFQSKYQVGDIDMDDASATPKSSTENQRDTWDMLRTIETTCSDAFDLLSYLCDDEMHSPEGSVSTDSSVVLKAWSPSKATGAMVPQVKVKTETETVKPTDKIRPASTITSSSIDAPIVSLRRSGKRRTSVSCSKVEKPYTRTRRSTRRYHIDSDSDDRTNAVHYRESREKNNEASRKSRMNKKVKENAMVIKAVELERDNRILKMKVEELEKLVTSMRGALLKSVLKKEV